jgi:stage II sporulation protein M
MRENKKGKRKDNKKDYFIYKKENLIILLGIFLFLFNFFYKIFFLNGISNNFIYYFQIISFSLIYFGLIIHPSFKKDNPILKSWNYIKKLKMFIYLSVILFLFSSLIGFFILPPDFIIEEILKLIQDILAQTEGMSSIELISFIFFNNLKSTLLVVLFGIFLGILPLISILFNGYLLGFVSSMAVGKSSLLELLRLFPHGIFELPAIFISVGVGLKLGTFLFQDNKSEFLKENFLNSLKVFFFIVIPLLIIAAIIEGLFISLS